MWYVATLYLGNIPNIQAQISKLGVYTLYELKSGRPIVEWKFSPQTFAVSYPLANGVIGITRNGKVRKCENIVPFSRLYAFRLSLYVSR